MQTEPETRHINGWQMQLYVLYKNIINIDMIFTSNSASRFVRRTLTGVLAEAIARPHRMMV
jgi:hypothetical protein